MIAALYVHKGGAYYGLPDVDPWDEERDARKYSGPYPVVAHPPCARWCALAGLVEARYGLKRGDDGGCFAAALSAVRKWGGVLEHPAFSHAWPAFGLVRPATKAPCWLPADRVGGWTAYVEQINYGHRARKSTWLYANKVKLPDLRWGHGGKGKVWISGCGNHNRKQTTVERMPKLERIVTPPLFRDLLIATARSVNA